MIVLQTIAVAFAMFSAIPVPQFDWNEKNMRYAMCAFPLIGVVIGAAWCVCGALPLPGLAKAAGFAVRGDFGLNIYNSRAMHYLRAQGLDSQLLSFEMTLPQIRDVSKAIPSEVLIYGRLPLMLMEKLPSTGVPLSSFAEICRDTFSLFPYVGLSARICH